MTSSIKPEVHNISQKSQRRNVARGGRTQPRPQGICHKHYSRSVQRPRRYARVQTNRQTHKQTDLRCTNRQTQTDRQTEKLCISWSEYCAPITGRSNDSTARNWETTGAEDRDNLSWQITRGLCYLSKHQSHNAVACSFRLVAEERFINASMSRQLMHQNFVYTGKFWLIGYFLLTCK